MFFIGMRLILKQWSRVFSLSNHKFFSVTKLLRLSHVPLLHRTDIANNSGVDFGFLKISQNRIFLITFFALEIFFSQTFIGHYEIALPQLFFAIVTDRFPLFETFFSHFFVCPVASSALLIGFLFFIYFKLFYLHFFSTTNSFLSPNSWAFPLFHCSTGRI